jgi:hypothetical protein
MSLVTYVYFNHYGIILTIGNNVDIIGGLCLYPGRLVEPLKISGIKFTHVSIDRTSQAAQ